MRILAISDIHGHRELLENVLKQASYKPGNDRLFLLGDYIDRGPDSLGTLELVKELVEGGAVALRGNHEQMLLDVLSERLGMPTWLRNGGGNTIESFSSGGRNWKVEVEKWQGFLESLPFFHYEGEYIFVHAGIRPGSKTQFSEDALWIREGFLDYPGTPYPGYTVVFGHTPTKYIAGHKKTKPWYAPGRIGIDTGAFITGVLTCVQLPCQCWQATA